MSQSKLFNDFANATDDEIVQAFSGSRWGDDESRIDSTGIHVLVANYTYEDYSGDAYVLFEREGQLFEVHGGHCSCYGLEGQWEPSAVTVDELYREAGQAIALSLVGRDPTKPAEEVANEIEVDLAILQAAGTFRQEQMRRSWARGR